MSAEVLAIGIVKTLLTSASQHAAARLVQRVVGSAKERAFRAAVRSAVQRFAELFPPIAQLSADSDFFGDSEVVSALFGLVMTDDRQHLEALANRFRAAYDEAAIFGTRAETALERFVELLEEELSEAGFLAERRDLKYLRRIASQLDSLTRAADEAPLAPAEALAAAQRIHERLALPPMSSDLLARIVVDQDVARLSLVPRPGRVLELRGRAVFTFTNDPEGIAARDSLRRAIETGSDATIPRKFIRQFELRVGGEPLPGTDGLPESVTLRAGPPNRFASRLVLYRMGRLLASVDVPHLMRVRVGTKETRFETEPGRPLEVQITVQLPPAARASGTFHIRFDRVRDALEGWPLMRFLLCGASADQMVWEVLDTGARGSLVSLSRPTAPTVSVRYLAHVRALASIQEATGVTMPWPWEGAMRQEVRRSLRIARALRVGARTHVYDRFDIGLDAEPDFESIMQHANASGEVSLNALEPNYRSSVGGTEIDLGPVLHWYPTVRVEARSASLHVRPGSDRRAFEVFVNYSEFELVARPERRLVIFSEPGAYPLAMLGLRRRAK